MNSIIKERTIQFDKQLLQSVINLSVHNEYLVLTTSDRSIYIFSLIQELTAIRIEPVMQARLGWLPYFIEVSIRNKYMLVFDKNRHQAVLYEIENVKEICELSADVSRPFPITASFCVSDDREILIYSNERFNLKAKDLETNTDFFALAKTQLSSYVIQEITSINGDNYLGIKGQFFSEMKDSFFITTIERLKDFSHSSMKFVELLKGSLNDYSDTLIMGRSKEPEVVWLRHLDEDTNDDREESEFTNEICFASIDSHDVSVINYTGQILGDEVLFATSTYLIVCNSRGALKVFSRQNKEMISEIQLKVNLLSIDASNGILVYIDTSYQLRVVEL